MREFQLAIGIVTKGSFARRESSIPDGMQQYVNGAFGSVILDVDFELGRADLLHAIATKGHRRLWITLVDDQFEVTDGSCPIAAGDNDIGEMLLKSLDWHHRASGEASEPPSESFVGAESVAVMFELIGIHIGGTERQSGLAAEDRDMALRRDQIFSLGKSLLPTIFGA